MDREQPVKQASPGHTVENNQFVTHAQKRFYASDLCKEARGLLQALVDSPDYNTTPSPLIINPDPFVERHLNRLSMHPDINLDGYISNLKLMTSTKHSKPTP